VQLVILRLPSLLSPNPSLHPCQRCSMPSFDSVIHRFEIIFSRFQLSSGHGANLISVAQWIATHAPIHTEPLAVEILRRSALLLFSHAVFLTPYHPSSCSSPFSSACSTNDISSLINDWPTASQQTERYHTVKTLNFDTIGVGPIP
jgi:hypothetical protein